MNLNEKWEELAEKERTQREYDEYWKDYFEKEMEVYRQMLATKDPSIKGTVTEFAAKYGLTPVEAAGFLSGVNTSLKEEIDLTTLTEDTQLDSVVDFEKLFFNMHEAKADWLFRLPEWDDVLSEQRRKEIKKEYDKTVTVVNTQKIGRNDPCPCGSGKKYKKCCGKNL